MSDPKQIGRYEVIRLLGEGNVGRVYLAKDPVLGPPVMQALRKLIRNCPEPYVHAEGGHFLQEWGDEVAQEALKKWK